MPWLCGCNCLEKSLVRGPLGGRWKSGLCFVRGFSLYPLPKCFLYHIYFINRPALLVFSQMWSAYWVAGFASSAACKQPLAPLASFPPQRSFHALSNVRVVIGSETSFTLLFHHLPNPDSRHFFHAVCGSDKKMKRWTSTKRSPRKNGSPVKGKRQTPSQFVWNHHSKAENFSRERERIFQQ